MATPAQVNRSETREENKGNYRLEEKKKEGGKNRKVRKKDVN